MGIGRPKQSLHTQQEWQLFRVEGGEKLLTYRQRKWIYCLQMPEIKLTEEHRISNKLGLTISSYSLIKSCKKQKICMFSYLRKLLRKKYTLKLLITWNLPGWHDDVCTQQSRGYSPDCPAATGWDPGSARLPAAPHSSEAVQQCVTATATDLEMLTVAMSKSVLRPSKLLRQV